MTKRFLIILTSLVSLSSLAVQAATTHHRSNVTLISGRPDFRLPFVRSIVSNGFSYIAYPEINLTTQQLSILNNHFVPQVSMAEIVDANGITNLNLLSRAIDFGSHQSPIVTFAIGGDSRVNNSICSMMANYPQTAFVTRTPHSGERVDRVNEPACEAHNILRVTALNFHQNDLADNAGYGDTIRIAAPSVNIPVTQAGGYHSVLSGVTPATMIVAAALSSFSNTHPELTGSALISQFLVEQSVVLPSLEGKVEDQRALINQP